MTIIDLPSPNCDSRENHGIDMLVLHYTGMKTAQEALNRLRDPEAKVSAHYMIDEDGTTYRLVPEAMRAWHAGVSYWRGNTNINQRSIGIELVNPGHEFGYRDFPKAQMEALAALCRDILSRHAIPPRNVVGHSDVAPARKEDPGERFNWEWLAKQGVGLWPMEMQNPMLNHRALFSLLFTLWLDKLNILVQLLPWNNTSGISRQEADAVAGPLPEYATIQKELALYGYDCPQTGMLDEGTRQCIVAFQRHFHPKWLTGQWNRSCALALVRLLAMV